MNPKTAEWLLAGFHAFKKDSKLLKWQGYSRERFFYLITSLLETEDPVEIVRMLENYTKMEPSLPSNLDIFVEEWEQAQNQNEERQARAAAKVDTFIKQQIQQKARLPKMTLAQAVRERLQEKPKEEPPEEVFRRIDLSLDNKIQNRLSEYDSILAKDPSQNTHVSSQIKDVLIAMALQSAGEEEKERVLPENITTLLRDNNISPEVEQKILSSIQAEKQVTPATIEKILTEKQVSQEVKEKILQSFRPQEEKGKALPLAVEEILRDNGIRLNTEQKKELFQSLLNDTKPEVDTLKKFAGAPIPETVLTTYALKTEPVAMTPLYAILHPQVALAYAQKTVLAPIVAFLNQGEPENLTQEQRESLAETRKGVTPEMINHTIENLKASGLPEDHPTIKKLEAHREKLDRFQTNNEGRKTPLTRIYETYHKAGNLVNASKIVDKQTGIALSNKPVWANSKSYSFKLKEFINNFSQKTGLAQKITVLPGKVSFRFPTSPRALVSSVYRNTAGRVVSGIKNRVAQSAVGAGVKKAAGWAVAKLGLKAIVSTVATAIGTAIGGPVGAFIAKALVFLAEKLLKPIISRISRALKDPSSAIGLIAGGLALAFFVPALASVGVGVAIVVAAGSAPAIAGAAASGIAGFISALAGMVVTIAVTAITIIILITLTVLTLFIVMVSSGAFILPVNPLSLYGGSRGLPPTVINPKCPNLIDLINNAAQAQCVPPAMLMATSRVEAGGTWRLDCTLLAKFITDKWWESATPKEIKIGYCYDTCAASGLCSGTTVMGPMQFEQGTWRGYMPGHTAMDRCRLDLSLEAAAKKIKNDSGTGSNCGPWSEKAVRRAAYRYCGSCGTLGCRSNPDPNDSCSSACGTDYCGMTWALYQQYAGR